MSIQKFDSVRGYALRDRDVFVVILFFVSGVLSLFPSGNPSWNCFGIIVHPSPRSKYSVLNRPTVRLCKIIEIPCDVLQKRQA